MIINNLNQINHFQIKSDVYICSLKYLDFFTVPASSFPSCVQNHIYYDTWDLTFILSSCFTSHRSCQHFLQFLNPLNYPFLKPNFPFLGTFCLELYISFVMSMYPSPFIYYFLTLCLLFLLSLYDSLALSFLKPFFTFLAYHHMTSQAF